MWDGKCNAKSSFHEIKWTTCTKNRHNPQKTL